MSDPTASGQPKMIDRRVVVRAGFKLAYTAPVVAASFRLSPLAARAQDGEILSGDGQPEPPAISKIESKEPDTVDITGRRLAGASVRVILEDEDTIPKVEDKERDDTIVLRTWQDGTIILNTERRIRFKLDGDTVFLQLTVLTPNGETKSKRKRIRVKSEPKPTETPEPTKEPRRSTRTSEEEDQNQETEQPVEPVEETPVSEEPVEEAPVEEAPVEEEPPVEEAPPVEEPPPTEEPPPAEPPIEINPRIQLSKDSGERGTDVQINGSGFLPGEITILWDGEWLASTGSGDGSFEVVVTVPDTAEGGRYSIAAQDSAGNMADDRFHVRA